ncbi:type II toxin-antitoxin system VapC family toxin [Spirosoma sordidisoli]|uniref:Type II toxin-antitoxin system VapC family toxin n=1 Tax=Spirosoma sordidisoli TaxID=2502893 RepID=A0A4Q2UHZ3_9BACT|nr:PIN domain-containing protein [Spirosoma sordidisoli]RYC68804.1 type II toxin-antitoxin system VapC family toxin [Spirosoma sordidisoli]
MIYIDTDVLVNFFVIQKQAPQLHPIAIKAVKQATDKGLLFISIHSLNELGFALAKCGENRDAITSYVSSLYAADPVSVTLDHLKRATQIAYKVSFYHTSDCLHTAIAEQYCDELITFNGSEFNLIRHHTKLKITVL